MLCYPPILVLDPYCPYPLLQVMNFTVSQIHSPLSLHTHRCCVQVMNFTVSRKGFGQVRWLRPVDITGLALDRIVVIQQGGSKMCGWCKCHWPVQQGGSGGVGLLRGRLTSGRCT